MSKTKDDHINNIRAAVSQLRSDWSSADGGIIGFLLCGASNEEIERDEKALKHALIAYKNAGHSLDDLPKNLKKDVIINNAIAEINSPPPASSDKARYFKAIRVALASYQQELDGSDDDEAEKTGQKLKAMLQEFVKAGHSASELPDDIRDSHIVKHLMEEVGPIKVTVSRAR